MIFSRPTKCQHFEIPWQNGPTQKTPKTDAHKTEQIFFCFFPSLTTVRYLLYSFRLNFLLFNVHILPMYFCSHKKPGTRCSEYRFFIQARSQALIFLFAFFFTAALNHFYTCDTFSKVDVSIIPSINLISIIDVQNRN